MAGAQAAPPARAATRRHGATRTVSIAAHVENLHPHHDGRPCRQPAAPGRLGRPGRPQCAAADRLAPPPPGPPAGRVWRLALRGRPPGPFIPPPPRPAPPPLGGPPRPPRPRHT